MPPMEDDGALQEVMEKLMAGRTKDITCPFCSDATMDAKTSAYGTRLVCPACKRYIDAPPMD